jgi:hypothetical protein
MTDINPNIEQWFVKDIEKNIFQSMSLPRTAQQLRKHMPIDANRLDIEATIEMTIRNCGLLTPVFDAIKGRPEYLVLVDRTTFTDHQALFVNHFVNQLIDEDVLVTRYYFNSDLRRCYPEEKQQPPFTLTELAEHYPNHKLIIFSDGNELINLITSEKTNWIKQFSVWSHLVLFTIETPEQWGYREQILDEAGFHILPATELATFAEQINTGIWQPYKLPISQKSDSTEFPEYLNERPRRWLERHAPNATMLTELLKQVRDFLGKDGYYWFSASAVYPELHWKLMLYLGYNVISTDESKLTVHLAKLVRLPWFRYGYMPDWLRKQLIADLPLEQEGKVRTALQALLLTTFEKPLESFHLDVAEQETALSALAKRVFSKLTKKGEKNSPLRDYVFKSFITDDLALKLPKIVNKQVFSVESFTKKLQSFPAFIYRQITDAVSNIRLLLRLPEWLLLFVSIFFQKLLYGFLFSLSNLRKRWIYLPPFPRKLAYNLLIGLSFFFLIKTTVYDLPLFINIQDASMDWIMLVNQKIIPPIQEKNIPSFKILDVNDKTHQAWGEPMFTPRNRIRNLIDAAVKAKAHLVIVAIDLTKKTPIESEKLKLHPNDKALFDYIKNYGEKCKMKQDKSVCPTIILVRAFKKTEYSPFQARISFLEKAVAQAAPYVQWASTLFHKTDDQVVRRWFLWHPTCTMKQEDIQSGVIASVELLSAILIRGISSEKLNSSLASFKLQNCIKDDVLTLQDKNEIMIGGLSVNTEIRGIHQRIMYTMPWLPPKREFSNISYFLTDTAGVPILTVFSAQLFAESPSLASLNALTESIVVIGESHYDSHNIYMTPLGEMPNTLILVNAIHSLLEYNTIELPSMWFEILLMSMLIIIMTWVLLMFHSFLGMIMSGVAVITCIILPVNIFLFRYGIWLDFVLPLIVVQFYLIASRFEEMRKLQSSKR